MNTNIKLINQIMADKKMTLSELADKSQLSRTTVTKVVKNYVTPLELKLDTISRVAESLGITIDEILIFDDYNIENTIEFSLSNTPKYFEPLLLSYVSEYFIDVFQFSKKIVTLRFFLYSYLESDFYKKNEEPLKRVSLLMDKDDTSDSELQEYSLLENQLKFLANDFSGKLLYDNLIKIYVIDINSNENPKNETDYIKLFSDSYVFEKLIKTIYSYCNLGKKCKKLIAKDLSVSDLQNNLFNGDLESFWGFSLSMINKNNMSVVFSKTI